MNATYGSDFPSFDPSNTTNSSCPHRFGARLLTIALGAASLVSIAGCGGGGGGGGFFPPAAAQPAATRDPVPAHDTTDLDLTLELSWQGEAEIFEVFFGPNELPDTPIAAIDETRFEVSDLKVDTNYVWRVDSILEDGTVVEGPLWNFETGNPFLGEPTLEPGNGEQNVQPTDLEIVAKFDRDLDASSVDANSFSLELANGERLPGRHEVDGATARFIPEAFTLPENAELFVKLSGILATDGRELQSDITSSFQTGEYELIRVNFQNEQAEVPAGHLRDFGLAFDVRQEANAGRGFSYGWVRDDNGEPFDQSSEGRDRGENEDGRLNTFLHMQQPIDVAWEIELPVGTYEVTVALGDGSDFFVDDHFHTAVVEGLVAIDRFVPNPPEQQHAFATITVPVLDGKLTLSPNAGANTKIPFVEIRRAGNLRFSVNFQSENADVPFGHLRDFGQAIDIRLDRNQGDGMFYGWSD